MKSLEGPFKPWADKPLLTVFKIVTLPITPVPIQRLKLSLEWVIWQGFQCGVLFKDFHLFTQSLRPTMFGAGNGVYTSKVGVFPQKNHDTIRKATI